MVALCSRATEETIFHERVFLRQVDPPNYVNVAFDGDTRAKNEWR